MVEHTDLPLEALDRSVHPRLVKQGADVVDQIAGGKIIGSIHHEVVALDQPKSIVGGEPTGIPFNPAIGIDARNPLSSGICLQLTKTTFRVNHLPLEVGELHAIIINDSDVTNTGCRQVHQQGRAESACPNTQHRCRFQPLLADHTEFRKHQMTGITSSLLGTQNGIRTVFRHCRGINVPSGHEFTVSPTIA